MKFKYSTHQDIEQLVQKRAGEEKLGSFVQIGEDFEKSGLQESTAKFVLLGVSEDIGPRANEGRAGADSAWKHFLPKFLNVQETEHLSGGKVLVLGNLTTEEGAGESSAQLRKSVKNLDETLDPILKGIFEAGKIPVLIGGGHNNAFPLIKAASQTFQKAINVVNNDPHADYRSLEGRHSGNSFSYAFSEGFLSNYFLLGFHESYNSKSMMESLKNDGHFSISYEDIFIREKTSYKNAVQKISDQLGEELVGIELDIDAIENAPSSAQTPSGISVKEARQYLHHFASTANAIYLHLPEAAPSLNPGNEDQVGKLLTYLAMDFMKARI